MCTARPSSSNKMTAFIPFLVLLALGFFVGKAKEHAHFNRLDREEAKFAHIRVVNVKQLPDALAPDCTLVTGNVVVAVDYYKKLISMLKMIFGGNLRSYESLMERARREAILRMKRDAYHIGANMIYNVRIENSTIGQQPQTRGGTELLAYGTAVKTA